MICLRSRVPPRVSSAEQAFDQRLAAQAEVLGDIAENAGQCTDPEGRVARNREVVLAAFEGGQSQVAAGLTRHLVAQATEDLGEIVTGDVPRQPQAVMTSSRTKWSRMTLGDRPSSK